MTHGFFSGGFTVLICFQLRKFNLLILFGGMYQKPSKIIVLKGDKHTELMLGVHVWHAFHRQQSFLINRDLNSEVFRHFLRTGRERQEVT